MAAQAGRLATFYCPADKKAYLDTSFFTTMTDRLGAGGDFAAAYVIAHEVAHHVQNELGILGQVHQARQRSNQTEANALTVRLELQADCLSGVWARSVKGLLEPGDIEEALNAARMIGDDHLQKRVQGACRNHIHLPMAPVHSAPVGLPKDSRAALSIPAIHLARVGCNA